jgi:hypothetical protein
VVGTESTWHRSLKMLAIVSVSHFDGNAVAIHIARAQHDSNAQQEYHSEKEICAVLSDFGISEGAIVSQLRLLSKTGLNEKLNSLRWTFHYINCVHSDSVCKRESDMDALPHSSHNRHKSHNHPYGVAPGLVLYLRRPFHDRESNRGALEGRASDTALRLPVTNRSKPASRSLPCG